MPDFRLQRRPPSCLVDRDLLLRLEDYMVKNTGLSEVAARATLSITIADAFGKETLASASELHGQKFADTTSSIEIEIGGGDARMAVSFERPYYMSVIRSQSGGPNAREIGMGRLSGIERVLEPSKTSGWFFNPPSIVFEMLGFFLTPFFVVSLVLAVLAWKNSQSAAGQPVALGFIVAALVLLFYQVGRLLNPYIRFASRRDDNMQRVWRWFGGGFATFIVFGSLLFFLRKQLFGF